MATAGIAYAGKNKKTMKNYIYLITFLFLFSCEEKEPLFLQQEFLGSQETGNLEYIDADLYSGIPSSKRTSFFTENFENNTNNWEEVSTSQAYASISNEQYVFQNKTANALAVSISKIIDTNNDFEIETRLKLVSTASNEAGSLIWGYKNTSPYQFYAYSINGNEKQWIGYFQNSYTAWQSWTPDYVNTTGEYNKLTIRKINNKYYFFMNEVFVFSQEFEAFFSHRIGFKADGYSTINIDYLKIDYIEN